MAVTDGSSETGDATQAELQALGDSVANGFAFIQDTDGYLYYSAGANIFLVAPGGEIVAAGDYASDIPAETIEQYLD